MPSPARPQPAAARAKADRRKRAQQETQRARTAATKAARAAAREKTGRLAKAARAAARVKTGRLRDLILKPYTLRVYKAAVAEFFRWCRRMGHRTPASVLSFDVLLCGWAEALFEDGDMKYEVHPQPRPLRLGAPRAVSSRSPCGCVAAVQRLVADGAPEASAAD